MLKKKFIRGICLVGIDGFVRKGYRVPVKRNVQDQSVCNNVELEGFIMYIAPDKQNWNGRVDSIHDEHSFRIHQMIQLKNMKELSENVNAYNIVGFESDEGVRRNKG